MGIPGGELRRAEGEHPRGVRGAEGASWGVGREGEEELREDGRSGVCREGPGEVSVGFVGVEGRGGRLGRWEWGRWEGRDLGAGG